MMKGPRLLRFKPNVVALFFPILGLHARSRISYG